MDESEINALIEGLRQTREQMLALSEKQLAIRKQLVEALAKNPDAVKLEIGDSIEVLVDPDLQDIIPTPLSEGTP